MNRRKFIKQAGLTAAGSLVLPYILPSGRLFAASGTRLVNHVVFVLFAGGLRNQETVDQQYISNQGGVAQGNLMENMLSGGRPTQNILYNRWAPALAAPLMTKGTLFREMRYAEGPTGHFNGHTVAMTGKYTETGLNLNINPDAPTLFEYYRKHTDPAKSAINAWWISEGLGPFPALNYSKHANYGPHYGANFLSPMTTFGASGQKYLNVANGYGMDDLKKVNDMVGFLDDTFKQQLTLADGIINTSDDAEHVKLFIRTTIDRIAAGQTQYALPQGTTAADLTGDLINISYAWQVLEEFKPELTVINTTDSDICHSNFSGYLQNLHKADFGVGWLWDKIQSDPELKDNTIMICMPDHGRNKDINTVRDANGFAGFDHTNDDNSRRIFSLIVGPPSVVKQNQVVGSLSKPVGETIDIVPTIAKILGFDPDIPKGMLGGRFLQEAFV